MTETSPSDTTGSSTPQMETSTESEKTLTSGETAQEQAEVEETQPPPVIAEEIRKSTPPPTIEDTATGTQQVTDDKLTQETKQLFLHDDSDDDHVAPNEPPKNESNKAYQCRFCGLSYNYMTTLKAHERVHNVEEPYVCPKCGETFRYNCELTYHVSSHKDQKVYKCGCGRSFYRYTDLLYHKHPGEDSDEEKLDEGEKERQRQAGDFRLEHPMKVYNDLRHRPYVCQYCCKAYADGNQLKQHMYSHRGERAFNPRASRYMMSRDIRLRDMP